MSSPRASKLRVVVAGGGVAGLETLMALRDLAGDRVEIALAAPDPDFTYRPMAVGEPFTVARAERRALEPVVRELGGRFIPQPLASVDADSHVVELASGELLPYDALVVCVGSRPRAPYRRGLTFGTASSRRDLMGILADVEGGWSKHVTFVVPPGVSWPLPVYELALMTERQAWSACCDDVRITVVTPEPAPLALFGKVASDAVAGLLAERGIEVIAGSYAREEDDGRLVLAPGSRPVDGRIVTLPVPHGPAIPGLPAGEDGFIPIDDHARVRGVDGVYAAGDGTSFPIKQGGLATQQADAAAEHIAARAGAAIEPQPFRPVLRGKLLTGGAPLYASHDLRGGAGEGNVSHDRLWWPPHKISGRYLSPWLAGETATADPEPPGEPLDIEVALPKDWHDHPLALHSLGPLRRASGVAAR